ncbi:MAG TPA: NADH-quinone oxidoreductase subunit NuoN [Oceanospirillales bacterium]|nr:NADH-quinone oxidoreductase subunit NuoN [Oceanospirillales bacterium]
MNSTLITWSQLPPILPELIILATACTVLILGLFLKSDKGGLLVLTSIVGVVFAAIATAKSHMGAHELSKQVLFNGNFVRDYMGDILKIAVYVIMLFVFIYAKQYLRNKNIFKGEFFALMLFGMLGIMIMISGYDYITLYVGLELLALSSYALVAYDRDNARSNESAMKYFILGAIASGMLLYGMSMIYGATGTLQINQISTAVAQSDNNLLVVFGLVFIMVGVSFKLGAAPFHMWVPDVYQGAPTATTLFISSAPKIAAFAFAIRILAQSLDGILAHWQPIVVVIALASIIIGNLFALQQTNIKRLFAYSTISHIGFMLLGFLGGMDGYSASMFYIITYALMSVAGFGMIIVLSCKGFEAEDISDFKGLNQRNGWFAFMMLLIVASMAGFPPLVGFFSKLYVLKAVVDQGYYVLAGVAVVFAVIGSFYYLRLIKTMYFDESESDQEITAGFDVKSILSFNAILQLALLLFIPSILSYCVRAIASL